MKMKEIFHIIMMANEKLHYAQFVLLVILALSFLPFFLPDCEQPILSLFTPVCLVIKFISLYRGCSLCKNMMLGSCEIIPENLIQWDINFTGFYSQ